MPNSRIETSLLLVAAAAAVVGEVLVYVGYSNPTLGFVVGSGNAGLPGALALVIFWGYAVYWSLDIRRALSSISFRSQALGMGLIATSWGTFNLVNITLNPAPGTLVGFTSIAILFAALLVTFYWIDSSMKAARRTDPMSRDPFHWEKLRIALWVLLVVTLPLLVIAFFVAPLQPIVYGPVGVLVIVLLIVVPIPSFMISVRRSRNAVMRKHLSWFGAALATWIAILAVGSTLPGANLSEAVSGSSYLIFAYLVYRSAKALAPLERLSLTKAGAT